MKNLKEDLKTKVYDLMYKNDIRDIVKILTNEYGLNDYIRNVSFSEEEFRGLSLENAIDYDQIGGELIINMSVLHSRFMKLTDSEAYPYNWMILFREICIAIEDVRLIKYENENVINPETRIKRAFDAFVDNESNNNYYGFLEQYKKDKVNKFQPVINPIERIKSIRSYFHTVDTFKKLQIDSTSIIRFKTLYDDELLEGYSINDQNVYPLHNLFFKSSYLEGRDFMKRFFKWYNDEGMVALSNATDEVNSLKERLALGYPIESTEYVRVRKDKI